MLINTAAVAENIRDIEEALQHSRPDRRGLGLLQDADLRPVADDGGTRTGVISYESALHYATNPSEFALRASGVDSASDRKFDEVTGGARPSRRLLDLTPSDAAARSETRPLNV